MSELAWMTFPHVQARMRTGEVSPVEYASACLDRIERYDGSYNAFVRVDAERALATARAAECAFRAGTPRPLEGVPYALKDIIDVAGSPTTCCSRILEHNLVREDAAVTRRLENAGAVLIGKLATHEFALGGPSFDLPWPPPRSPWNRDRFPGGSSSGSGVAVAAGFVPIALGSDTGGSVRNPAANCGIVGMKPSYGRVSRRGVFPLAFSLDHVGPMTRTVAENAAVLAIIAGHDPADPGSARREVPDFLRDLEAGVAGLRVGLLRHFYTRDIEADPEVAAAIEATAGMLAGLGAQVDEVATRPLDEFRACQRLLLVAEGYAVHRHWLRERPQDYGALTRERLLAGAFLDAADYVQASRARRTLAAAVDALYAAHDVVLTVNAHDPPCRIDDQEAIERAYVRQARAPFNLSGHPALALPCGFTREGQPLSLQIVGRMFDEATVYRTANALERAGGWHARHPELAAPHDAPVPAA